MRGVVASLIALMGGVIFADDAVSPVFTFDARYKSSGITPDAWVSYEAEGLSSRFSAATVTRAADVNSNGIPDEWELYECQVEFLYEDWPALPANGPSGVFGRSEDSRCQGNRRRIRLNEFNHPNGLYSLEEMMRRCLTDPVLRHENAQRSMNILSRRQFEVVEGSCLHSLCKYRLVLTDAEKRNLDLYARLCIAVIKERDAREREIRADKAARDENQEMKKAERRLLEMEKSIAQGSAKPGFEEELRQHRKMVDDLKARVDDIRLAALSTSARGIVYEFKPRLAWSIRRRTP